MLSCFCDLYLDPMTLYELDLKILKMYQHTKHTAYKKVRALQTDRHTDRRD